LTQKLPESCQDVIENLEFLTLVKQIYRLRELNKNFGKSLTGELSHRSKFA